MQTRDHHEADFQRDFKRWVKHKCNFTSAFELKVTPTDRINLNRLESHQFMALKAVKHKKLYYRIPDTDFYHKRPFDCLQFVECCAYVVVMFRNIERGQKEFFLIDIDKWEAEKDISKSFTESRAKELGIRCELKG